MSRIARHENLGPEGLLAKFLDCRKDLRVLLVERPLPVYNCRCLSPNTCFSTGWLRSVAVLRMRNGTPSPPFALRSATACKCPNSPRSGTAATALRACAPVPTTNGLTGRRMCLHIASAAPGAAALTPLRRYARTYPYPGLPATRFALPWRAAEEASEAERNKASRPYDGLAGFSKEHKQQGAQLLATAATLERGY